MRLSQQIGNQVALLLQEFTRLGGLNGIGRQLTPALCQRRKHVDGLRHILLAATIILFATARFRLLTA
ncbi:hypothetical protein D3C86_1766840 [compost metagenome]